MENNDLMESNATAEKSLPNESKLTWLAEHEQDEIGCAKRLGTLPRTGFI